MLDAFPQDTLVIVMTWFLVGALAVPALAATVYLEWKDLKRQAPRLRRRLHSHSRWHHA